MSDQTWLTPTQAAAYLGNAFSAQAVCDACRDGRLKHSRPGGHRIVIKREWIDQWCMLSAEGGVTPQIGGLHE